MTRLNVFWGLVALTTFVYVLLLAVAGPRLLAHTSLPVPDLKLTGYDLAYFRELLEGADEGFPEAYARFAHSWDIVFPVLASFTFGFGMWVFGLPKVLWLAALFTGLSDLTENALALRLIEGGVENLSARGVALANAATLSKWVFYTLSILLLFYGFFRHLAKNR